MNQRIVLSMEQLQRAQPGGIATYIRGLVRGLDELQRADDVTIDVEGIVPRGPRDVKVQSRSLEIRNLPVGVRSLTRLWRCWPVGVDRRATVVHATTMAGPLRGGAKNAVHSVFVHDLLWRDHPELTTPRGRRFHERQLQKILATSSLRVLVWSNAMRERLAEEGVEPGRLHVITLGVDANTQQPSDAARQKLFSRLGLNLLGSNGIFTLVVGTIEPRKNLERVISAHRKATARGAELGPLVIVGRQGWGSVNLEGSVWLPEVNSDDLDSLHALCRVALYAPIEEGWGIPPIEALAAGRPVVASSTVPSVASEPLVEHVDPLSVDAICDGLQRALARNDDELARAQRRAAVSRFTWQQCARDHLRAWS